MVKVLIIIIIGAQLLFISNEIGHKRSSDELIEACALFQAIFTEGNLMLRGQGENLQLLLWPGWGLNHQPPDHENLKHGQS